VLPFPKFQLFAIFDEPGSLRLDRHDLLLLLRRHRNDDDDVVGGGDGGYRSSTLRNHPLAISSLEPSEVCLDLGSKTFFACPAGFENDAGCGCVTLNESLVSQE